MNLKNNIFAIWFITALVGIYQLPLIENKLISYDIELSMNKYFPYSQKSQQHVENYKIMLSAQLDNVTQHKDNVTQPNIDSLNNKKDENTILQAQEKRQNDTSKNDINKKVNHASLATEVKITHENLAKSPCKINCKVLMIGDSVMGDVAFSLTRLMTKNEPSWKVITAHKVSSGLVNSIYYDWPTTAYNLVKQHQPDYVLVLMGTNDAVNMSVNGKTVALGSPDWINNYSLRMNKINDHLNEKKIVWNWIQLPVVRSPNFNKKLQFVRNVQKMNSNEHLIETETLFGSIEQKDTLDMSLRNTDGIHLNTKGANLVAKHVYEYMNKKYMK